jgi:hypothetical protein
MQRACNGFVPLLVNCIVPSGFICCHSRARFCEDERTNEIWKIRGCNGASSCTVAHGALRNKQLVSDPHVFAPPPPAYIYYVSDMKGTVSLLSVAEFFNSWTLL